MENGDDNSNVSQGLLAKFWNKMRKGVAGTGKAVEKMQDRRGSTKDEQEGLMGEQVSRKPGSYGT